MNIKNITLLAGAASIAALVSVIGLAGCASPNTNSGANAKPASTATVASKGGSQLWSENCARCHNIRPPSSYNDAQWDVAMMHMRVRANMTAEEQKKILEFLKSAD